MKPTGNGTGLLGMPGDVTPPSQFVRATVLAEVSRTAKDARAAVNQVFHCLDLVSVPRDVAPSGDATQWYVARDHDGLVYYVRSYDGWMTDAHDLKASLGRLRPEDRARGAAAAGRLTAGARRSLCRAHAAQA